jgi:hypothetical protein
MPTKAVQKYTFLGNYPNNQCQLLHLLTKIEGFSLLFRQKSVNLHGKIKER